MLVDGTGLGLGFFIAKTLLERSGGRVSFRNRSPGDELAQAAGTSGPTGAIVEVVWSRKALEARSEAVQQS